MTWSRPVSGIERAWLAAAEVHPPFVVHTVLEGTGEPDLDAWRGAVELAVRANPGAAAVLRGAACRTRWTEAGACAVREVTDAVGWNGLSGEGEPWVDGPMDLRHGPTLELLVVRAAAGVPARLVLRCPHALMDGAGILALLSDVFRARNGQSPRGNDDRRTDLELCGPGPAAGPPPADALPPLGPPGTGEAGARWRRVVAGAPGPHLLARVAIAVARHARRFGEGTVRLDLAVGQRRRHPDVCSTANLTGMLAVEVPPDAQAAALAESVRTAAAAGAHEPRIRGAGFLRHLPQAWVNGAARRADRDHLSRTSFSSTATVSNVGPLALDDLQAPDFATQRLFFVPPPTEVTPLFVVCTGTASAVDIVVSAPRRFASAARLDALMVAVAGAAVGQ